MAEDRLGKLEQKEREGNITVGESEELRRLRGEQPQNVGETPPDQRQNQAGTQSPDDAEEATDGEEGEGDVEP